MTSQRARDAQARAMAKAWAAKNLSREEVLGRLNGYASRPEHLHLTPHLVTAAHAAGLLRERVDA